MGRKLLPSDLGMSTIWLMIVSIDQEKIRQQKFDYKFLKGDFDIH